MHPFGLFLPIGKLWAPVFFGHVFRAPRTFSLLLQAASGCCIIHFALDEWLNLQGDLYLPQRSCGQTVVTGVDLLSLGTCLHFHRALGSAFPLLVDFHRMLLTHALAFAASHFLC